MSVVGWRLRQMFVVPDHVVRRVAHHAAREAGQVGTVHVLVIVQQLGQFAQRIVTGHGLLAAGAADSYVIPASREGHARIGPDERIAGDLLAADDAFQKERVPRRRISRRHGQSLIGRHRRQGVRQQLAVHRHGIAPLGLLEELVKGWLIVLHRFSLLSASPAKAPVSQRPAGRVPAQHSIVTIR